MKYVTKTHLKQGIHIVALFLETRIVFSPSFWEKQLWSYTPFII